ncbi:hypothetical protein PIB30_098970 [Stylosanthes scabra]|uniref:Uncharacterized protein n=1 Tax=Stylosanthes scabra TaxID=79078 RepID=A0ABU6QX08_9FABA|nr:hypothetical protein [Stylosanthes scabra]
MAMTIFTSAANYNGRTRRKSILDERKRINGIGNSNVNARGNGSVGYEEGIGERRPLKELSIGEQKTNGAGHLQTNNKVVDYFVGGKENNNGNSQEGNDLLQLHNNILIGSKRRISTDGTLCDSNRNTSPSSGNAKQARIERAAKVAQKRGSRKQSDQVTHLEVLANQATLIYQVLIVVKLFEYLLNEMGTKENDYVNIDGIIPTWQGQRKGKLQISRPTMTVLATLEVRGLDAFEVLHHKRGHQ